MLSLLRRNTFLKIEFLNMLDIHECKLLVEVVDLVSRYNLMSIRLREHKLVLHN